MSEPTMEDVKPVEVFKGTMIVTAEKEVLALEFERSQGMAFTPAHLQKMLLLILKYAKALDLEAPEKFRFRVESYHPKRKA